MFVSASASAYLGELALYTEKPAPFHILPLCRRQSCADGAPRLVAPQGQALETPELVEDRGAAFAANVATMVVNVRTEPGEGAASWTFHVDIMYVCIIYIHMYVYIYIYIGYGLCI